MKADFHSHTTYCDGSLSAEDMVKAAIARGLRAFGFSEHSYDGDFDPIGCGISAEDLPGYIKEIRELQAKYADEIEVYLGLEQDVFSPPPPEGLDYIIGSVHYVKVGDQFPSVDNGAVMQAQMVEIYFGGDYYAMCEAYFKTVAEAAAKLKPDIIGHFDLVTKYNKNGERFDESDKRYLTAAITAMDEALKHVNLFEVNTGGMYRAGKLEPYPSLALLKELKKRGGEVILSGDSHDGAGICHKFDDMRLLLRNIGFKYVKTLTKDGFTDTVL